MKGPGDLVRALAQRWHVSEGQVYTAIIGVVLALSAAVGGIPPTLAEKIEARGRNTSRVVTSEPVDDSSSDEAPAAPNSTGDGAPPLRFPGAGVVPTPVFDDVPSAAPAPELPAPTRRPAGDYRVFARVPSPGAPQGVAVAPDGRVLIATNNGDGRGADGKPVLFVYDAEGTQTKKVTVSNVAAGHGLHDLVLPPGGNGDIAYGIASDPAAVLLIDVAASKATSFAAIPDIPSCLGALGAEPCETSALDNLPEPSAAVFDASGALIVADAGQSVLWRVKPDRSVALFHKATEFVALDGLSGLALGKDNTLYVSVAQAPTAAGRGAIYKLVDGTLSQFAVTDPATAPRGLTVARSGRVYVALSGSGRVLVLNADGTPNTTLPTDAALTFDTPVRVAFSPVALLVVEQAPTRPTAGSVVELGVDDAPL